MMTGAEEEMHPTVFRRGISCHVVMRSDSSRFTKVSQHLLFWTQSSFLTHCRTFLHRKSNVFFSKLWLWLMWIQALEDPIVLYLRMRINIIIFYLLKSCWIFVHFVVLDMKVHSTMCHSSNFNEVLSRFSDCDHLQPSPFIIKTICGFPSTYIHVFLKQLMCTWADGNSFVERITHVC